MNPEMKRSLAPKQEAGLVDFALVGDAARRAENYDVNWNMRNYDVLWNMRYERPRRSGAHSLAVLLTGVLLATLAAALLAALSGLLVLLTGLLVRITLLATLARIVLVLLVVLAHYSLLGLGGRPFNLTYTPNVPMRHSTYGPVTTFRSPLLL
jgi:hypothetical protein